MADQEFKELQKVYGLSISQMGCKIQCIIAGEVANPIKAYLTSVGNMKAYAFSVGAGKKTLKQVPVWKIKPAGYAQPAVRDAHKMFLQGIADIGVLMATTIGACGKVTAADNRQKALSKFFAAQEAAAANGSLLVTPVVTVNGDWVYNYNGFSIENTLVNTNFVKAVCAMVYAPQYLSALRASTIVSDADWVNFLRCAVVASLCINTNLRSNARAIKDIALAKLAEVVEVRTEGKVMSVFTKNGTEATLDLAKLKGSFLAIKTFGEVGVEEVFDSANRSRTSDSVIKAAAGAAGGALTITDIYGDAGVGA